ncbi:hypothetical protein TVAG_389600 [Trichomonas vaginalis G3]|uniref:Uncharacterized protein n=1 Tax=Trichomonas vaginalis (strain ATCC PRA-98 / G3) TaxID=412133 RepID=A2E162_TRIV3|nr:hypothetical protein TVAGG3_0938910 [Trichomonas vaginalis G3]EAY13563.1 hypothetical protein TVAG_389600 [Trichomonas vaginalis G3]KAI5486391.1 hypothetical protein TVAGG3_0938910 [Trichomonas vaginalis G3]|eukprot:XP_001325786.1 hypothetical protein [Trichomonas vaginalis G3]
MKNQSQFTTSLPNLETNYEALYKEEAKKFWELQKVQQTAEEKEFEELCHKLEQMSRNYRDEIDKVAEENQQLQLQYKDIPSYKRKLEEMEIEEQNLIRIKSNF